MLNAALVASSLIALASALGRSPIVQPQVCKVDQCLSAINAHDVVSSTARGRVPVAGCSSFMAVTVSPCPITKTVVQTTSAPATIKTITSYTEVVSIVTSTYTPVVTIRVPAPRNFTSPISTGSPSRNFTSPGSAPPARNFTSSGPSGPPAVNVTEPARPAVNVTESARVAVNVSSPVLSSNSSSPARNATLQRRDPINFGDRIGLNTAIAICTPKLITSSIIPSYASACSNAAQYSSACACAKFAAKTITAGTPGTTTKSITNTIQATVTVRSTVTNVKSFTKTVVGPAKFVTVTVGGAGAAGPTAGR